jgi:hypothetical protein
LIGSISWVVKADSDPMWQPSVSSKAYKEARDKIHKWQNMVNRMLSIRRRHDQVTPLTEQELINFAIKDDDGVSSCSSGGISDDASASGDGGGGIAIAKASVEEGLDPECSPLFMDKKMVFDMSEDFEEEQRKTLEKVNEIKRQMEEAGVFDVHRRGAEERSQRKAELGFNGNFRLADGWGEGGP